MLAPVFASASLFVREQILQRQATITHYVITNNRGLIIEGLKVRDVSPHLVKRVQVSDEIGGFRSLVFDHHSGWQIYAQPDTSTLSISGGIA